MRIAALIVICLLSLFTSAQTSLSGIVNNYYPVTAYNAATTTLTVSSSAGITIGDTLLLMQMKGATINGSNSPSYGDVMSYGGAGHYELVVVCDIAGNDIVLSELLEKSYSAGGGMQLISFPDETSISIDGNVTAQDWDGSSGGVVVMRAQNSITLNDTIDVSYQGFRGGTHINSPFSCSFLFVLDDYEYDAAAGHGAMKGEGIATPPMNGGRGAAANGGGGGNDHNSGGGGGSNTTAGGIGGINDEPNSTLCQGDYPGMPGTAITATTERIYLGGGGGAGHSNSTFDNKAGDGGGIVILMANEIIGNGNYILSNGEDGLRGFGDGGSGGGAGGSILLYADNITGTLNLEANGGNGGEGNGAWYDDMGAIFNSTNPNRCFGPGGGGSGGMIRLKGSTTPTGVNISYTGGTNGLVANTAETGCDGQSLGAAPGNSGSTQYNGEVIINDKINKACQFNPQLDLGADTVVCENGSLTLTSTLTGTYEWSTGETTQSITISSAGTYTVKVGVSGRFICDTIIISQAGLTVDLGPDQEICGSQTATLDAGPGGITYTWSTSESSQTIVVNSAGTYSVTVDDGTCINSDDVVITKCIEQLFIPNTITPNGDGENDTWIIEGLDDFEGNTVVIMNRNGAVVFEAVNYQSDWNGDGLPASTYYYQLDLNDGVSTYKGSISILRQQ